MSIHFVHIYRHISVFSVSLDFISILILDVRQCPRVSPTQYHTSAIGFVHLNSKAILEIIRGAFYLCHECLNVNMLEFVMSEDLSLMSHKF